MTSCRRHPPRALAALAFAWLGPQLVYAQQLPAATPEERAMREPAFARALRHMGWHRHAYDRATDQAASDRWITLERGQEMRRCWPVAMPTF